MNPLVTVPGPKILLMGNPGDGKTDSVRTLVEAGLKVFIVFTEPGMEVLLDARRKVYSCADGLHWHYIPPVSVDWTEMKNAADLLNKFSYKQLSEMAPVAREKFRGWYEFISTHANLTCDRCKQAFGPADQLQPYDKWAVVDDSLSSLSIMALNIVIGAKPAVHQGEYGVAMFNLERFINKFTYDMPSMGVMMAHVEREEDTVGGGLMNMAATLGRKLAPKVPRPFSDVLLAKRDGGKFTWSNITSNYTLKSRHFPFSGDIEPSFVPAVREWHRAIAAELAAKGGNVASITR